MRVVRRRFILILAAVISVASVMYQLSISIDACRLDKVTAPQNEEEESTYEKSDKYVKVINDESEEPTASENLGDKY